MLYKGKIIMILILMRLLFRSVVIGQKILKRKVARPFISQVLLIMGNKGGDLGQFFHIVMRHEAAQQHQNSHR